jgi:choline kinase
MQAIILAAGMGSRLKNLTQNLHKGLIEIAGHSLLKRSTRILARCGVSSITVVTGYLAEQIREHLGGGTDGVPISYVDNPRFATTNNMYSLLQADGAMAGDDALVLSCDLFFERRLIERMLNHASPNLLAVAKYRPPMQGIMVKLAKGNRVAELLTKNMFRPEDANEYFKTVNINRFSRDFSARVLLPFIRAYCGAFGENDFYEHALRCILPVSPECLTAISADSLKWWEVDTDADLATVTAEAAGLE